MKVKVNAGWQLGLPDEAKLYYEGDTFDAPDALAEEWIAGGLAVAVKAVTESKNKAVASADSPNKSQTFTSTPKTVDVKKAGR